MANQEKTLRKVIAGIGHITEIIKHPRTEISNTKEYTYLQDEMKSVIKDLIAINEILQGYNLTK
jgi:hypothetical protein